MGPRAAHALALVLSLAAAGCHKKIRPDECGAMVDRYIDMIVAADPSLKTLPPTEAAARTESRKAAKKAEALHAGTQARCEADVSRPEYECAMAAKNPEEWEACIE